MAISDLNLYRQFTHTLKVIEMEADPAPLLADLQAAPIMEPTGRPSYVIANHDWPAVRTLQSDEEAYEALVSSFHRVDDRAYDAAMAALKQTKTPPGL